MGRGSVARLVSNDRTFNLFPIPKTLELLSSLLPFFFSYFLFTSFTNLLYSFFTILSLSLDSTSRRPRYSRIQPSECHRYSVAVISFALLTSLIFSLQISTYLYDLITKRLMHSLPLQFCHFSSSLCDKTH